MGRSLGQAKCRFTTERRTIDLNTGTDTRSGEGDVTALARAGVVTGMTDGVTTVVGNVEIIGNGGGTVTTAGLNVGVHGAVGDAVVLALAERHDIGALASLASDASSLSERRRRSLSASAARRLSRSDVAENDARSSLTSEGVSRKGFGTSTTGQWRRRRGVRSRYKPRRGPDARRVSTATSRSPLQDVDDCVRSRRLQRDRPARRRR